MTARFHGSMTLRATVTRLTQQGSINFLLTNRIPRRQLTRFVGWFSKIEQPLVRDVSIAVWRFFCDVDLSDARRSQFRSMHDCFIRELNDDARPIDTDPAILVSPCDAIVGACGAIREGEMFQAKELTYSLDELIGDAAQAAHYRNGSFATLRLTAGMYHRFHAPHDCRVEAVTYMSGDVWNVNPAAVCRVDRLYCRNERAVIRTTLTNGGYPMTLVPVGAILVASIRLHFMTVRLPDQAGIARPCDAAFRKGEEMGWFEHGSTIIALVPPRFSLCPTIVEGARIRMGQPLCEMPAARP